MENLQKIESDLKKAKTEYLIQKARYYKRLLGEPRQEKKSREFEIGDRVLIEKICPATTGETIAGVIKDIGFFEVGGSCYPYKVRLDDGSIGYYVGADFID